MAPGRPFTRETTICPCKEGKQICVIPWDGRKLIPLSAKPNLYLPSRQPNQFPVHLTWFN